MTLHGALAARGQLGHVLGTQRGGAAVAGNGLLNALIAYWPGSEANGNALDLHTSALHLTQVNNPGSNSGIVYALARQLNGTSQYFARNSEILLQAGDTDFTWASWLYLDAYKVYAQRILSKRAAGNNLDYDIFIEPLVNRFNFIIANAAGVSVSVDATNFGAIPLNVWVLVLCWHDSVANTINISINNGVENSSATVAVVPNSGTGQLRVGDLQQTGSRWLAARVQSACLWKSAAGLGGVLTAAQRTALWNGGAGLTYASFTT